ncbi:MAG: flagellar hook-length control protein FliK [Clostridiales bacterium]|nr:flagellar hook-length control protein FliK [Clostridiales bacterium]
MNSLIIDKGIDFLLEVLGQSQSVWAAMEQSNNVTIDENNSQKDESISNYGDSSPLTALLRPNTDGVFMLSKKESYESRRKKDEYFKELKSCIDNILNRMTEKDYARLSESGLKIEDLTVESLAIAVDLIKEYGDYNELVSKTPEKRSESSISEDEIKARMETVNLPVTKESLKRILNALSLSEGIPSMDMKEILYLLQNNKSPSIDNIYKARYSSQNTTCINELSQEQWKELEPQICEILSQMDVPTNTEYLEKARWLIENNLPVTKENINYIIGLEELRTSYDKDLILNKILKGMKEGFLPGQADLLKTDITKDQLLKSITAKRLLEEVRLRMTSEAARRFAKRGIDVDTKNLEKVVDQLRIEEEKYYKDLLQQEGIAPDEARINILKATSQSVEQLKTMPINIIGATLEDRRLQTITSLLDNGNNIIIELDKAKEAYETFYTQPRKEFGDSIKKAFNNMGTLMEEMDIPDTEYNRRAIRILGYNQMDISKESIDKVKAYDLSVNYLLENLHPKITVQLIKEGINPMDIPIDQLNSQIERLKEELDNPSLEKYSTYLYKLEKEDGISEAERKAYIGIYRLLYQIDKSDGAPIGALVKSDTEVTLNHLLTAIRTIKKGGMDYKLDDKYGLVEEIRFDKETIINQIEAGFNSDSNNQEPSYMAKEDPYMPEQSNQEEIHNNIIKQLLNNLTPERLYQLHHSIAEKSQITADPWDTLGNMTIDQLLEQAKNTDDQPGINQAYYSERLQEIREIYNNSDQAIRFLNDYKMPCTTTNLMMAGQILNNSCKVFRKLFGIAQNEKDENLKNRLKKNFDLTDTLIDEDTMNKAYEKLDRQLKAVIDMESSADNVDGTQLAQLKSMGNQMKFMKHLARRRFYQIPIESSGRITNINLTIICQKTSGGKVTVSYESDKLGSIKAEASLKDKKLSGYFSCDHMEGLKMLKAQEGSLKEGLHDEHITIKQLNFYMKQSWDGVYTYKNPEEAQGETDRLADRILYRVAKAMISMIRLAEEEKEAALVGQ